MPTVHRKVSQLQWFGSDPLAALGVALYGAPILADRRRGIVCKRRCRSTKP
jgi:hypothetical protein